MKRRRAGTNSSAIHRLSDSSGCSVFAQCKSNPQGSQALQPAHQLLVRRYTTANQVKICDFGLVRSLDQDYDEKAQVLSDEIATRWYRSPEILLGCQSYGRPIDMWSVGCIIAEMITGSPLFPGNGSIYPGNSTIDQLERILAFTGNPTKRELEALDNPFA